MRLLAPHFRHKLFLTATPHNGDRRSFAALLELLDDQRFTREIWPRESDPKSDEIFQKRLTPVFVRRLKSDLVDAEGKRRYPERRLEALRIDYAYDERDARRQLEAYIKTCENGPDGGRAVDHFVHQLLRKRLSSSPAAFAATLERHIATIEGPASSGRSQRKFDDRILRRAIAKTEEDYADDAQRDATEAEAIEEAGKHARPPTDEERRMLDRLRSWAQQAARRTDAKASALLDWLAKHVKDGPSPRELLPAVRP